MTRYTIEKSLLDKHNGYITLGDCFVGKETENDFISFNLVAKTPKGYASKKEIPIEKAKVIGTEIDNGRTYCIIDPSQIEPLIKAYDRKANCKEYFGRVKPMDATTAFGLAGNKYGWIYDRI